MSVQEVDGRFIRIWIAQLHFNVQPTRELREFLDDDFVIIKPPLFAQLAPFAHAFDWISVSNPFPGEFPDFACRQPSVGPIFCHPQRFLVVDPVGILIRRPSSQGLVCNPECQCVQIDRSRAFPVNYATHLLYIKFVFAVVDVGRCREGSRRTTQDWPAYNGAQDDREARSASSSCRPRKCQRDVRWRSGLTPCGTSCDCGRRASTDTPPGPGFPRGSACRSTRPASSTPSTAPSSRCYRA